MADAHRLIVRRSIILWIATGVTIAFNLFAASRHDPMVTYLALGLTGLVALGGIGFGLWAGLSLRRAAGSVG